MSHPDTPMHPIIEHVFAALDLEHEAPTYDAEDLEALELALREVVDDEACVTVYAGLVEWIAVLHRHDLIEALDQLLVVVGDFQAQRPCLDASALGHDAHDGLERGGPRGWSAFAAASSIPTTPATGGMSLLALRALS